MMSVSGTQGRGRSTAATRGRVRQPSAADSTTAAVRRFNRFYTRRLGLLGAGLLNSRFSLTQARVLYELAHRGPLVAGDLVRELGLDAGYLSRLLKAFERDGLIERSPSAVDGRRVDVRLSAVGHEAQAALDRASNVQVSAMIESLGSSQRGQLRHAFACIEKLLTPVGVANASPAWVGGSKAGAWTRSEMETPSASAGVAGSTGVKESPGDAGSAAVLRAHRPGDIGWVVHRHGVLYAAEYGWNERFEALVAEIGAGLLRSFDPKREASFIAERDGRILGAAFLVKDSDDTAKIRLVYVEPEARGLGLGRQLTEACIDGARQRGYRRITLWTNSVLTAARHIYASAGFQRVAEERYDDFGATDLIGEHWSLELAPPTESTAAAAPTRRKR